MSQKTLELSLRMIMNKKEKEKKKKKNSWSQTSVKEGASIIRSFDQNCQSQHRNSKNAPTTPGR